VLRRVENRSVVLRVVGGYKWGTQYLAVSLGYSVLGGYSNTGTWKKRMHTDYRWEILKERSHWEDQDIGGQIILSWI
jgi:hypothetical protein